MIDIFFKNNFIATPKTIAVAVSGGVDSMALLFLLNEFCQRNKIKLHAITVDHKIRQASTAEAAQLAKILAKHKINHQILTINAAKIPQKNIEMNLREARYELLCSYCTENKIEHLFLGHHAQDIAENFLIRLFRGSQIDGLAAMSEISQRANIKLCRPLLAAQKDELKKFLQSKKIKWFEDETNSDEKFLRNKIRNFLESFSDKNLICERIGKAAQILSETRNQLDEILLEKAKKCLKFIELQNINSIDSGAKANAKNNASKGFKANINEFAFILNLAEYKKIPPNIAQKILSLVLVEISGDIYKPRLEGLKNFEKNIFALQKTQKKNFYGCMAKIDKATATATSPQIIIYRDQNEAQKPTKKFSKTEILIDGRILQTKGQNPQQKFHFRTILGKIFNS